MGVIREWANKNFREEEPRPDSFLERFRGPELQTVTTQQGDGKGDKDGDGKATKYRCAWEHAVGGWRGATGETSGVHDVTAVSQGPILTYAVLPPVYLCGF